MKDQRLAKILRDCKIPLHLSGLLTIFFAPKKGDKADILFLLFAVVHVSATWILNPAALPYVFSNCRSQKCDLAVLI